MAQEDVFKKIVSHCKEYGFVFPSSEIYDGLAAVYDYGQNGVELKNNIKQYWWQSMVLLHENIVGLDAAIFMHPTVWKASGHVDAFNDPLIDNRDSKKRYRADVLIEDHMAKYEEKIAKEIAKAKKRFGDSFDEAQFRATNPRVLENQKKFDDLHARYTEAMQGPNLEMLKQIIEDEGIVCPISGTKNWTDVRHNMIGVRVAESVQRRQNIASIKTTNNGLNGTYKIFPIYDWKDSDVWLYLAKRKVDIPEIYVYLWRTGTRKTNMRVSQFFSVDTARSLVKLNEYYPDLMERVIRREPNAYLAMLYWDSEMFGRSSSKRRELEKDEKPKDYRALLEDLFKNLPRNFTTAHSMDIARKYRMMYIKFKPFLKPRLLQRMYEALIAGDPKLRNYGAIYLDCGGAVSEEGKVTKWT